MNFPFKRLKDKEHVPAREWNKLCEMFAQFLASATPGITRHEVLELVSAEKIMARIVGREDYEEGQSPIYSWVAVRSDADGNHSQHPISMRGDANGYPAYEEHGNPLVPIDGTVEVELKLGPGPYYFFSYKPRETWAKLTGSSGALYAWTEVYPTTGGAFSEMTGGRTGTTSINAARERHGIEGIANNTVVRIERGYCSGAPRVIVTRQQVGDGEEDSEIQQVRILDAVGGTFTLTHEGQTTAAIAYNANAAAVESALEALSNIVGCSVTGSGTSGSPFVVTFEDDFNEHPFLQPDEGGLLSDQEWLFEAGAAIIPGECIAEQGIADDTLALTSDTWTDVPGTDVEITVESERGAALHAVFDFDGNGTAEVTIDGNGAGSLDLYEGRILIDGTPVDAIARFTPSHPAHRETVAFPPMEVTLAAGTYTVKAQARKASGDGEALLQTGTRWLLESSCGDGGYPTNVVVNNWQVNNYYTYAPYSVTLTTNTTNFTINSSVTLVNLTANVEITNILFSRTFLDGDQITIINTSTAYFLTLKITGNIESYSLTEISIGPNMVLRLTYVSADITIPRVAGLKLYKEPCWHQPYRPSQITSNQASYALAWSATYFDLDFDANRTIYGFANYYSGRLFFFFNRSDFTVTIPHESSSAGTAAQRVYTQNGQSCYIGTNQGAWFIYDGNAQRWRQITGQVRYQMSITEDANGLKLSGDVDDPGSFAYYGTPLTSNTKGWWAFPTSGDLGGSYWVKVTKTYADLAAASTTNQITIYTLPAKGVVHAAYITHTTAFTGGGLGTYVLDVGTIASPSEFTGAYGAEGPPPSTGAFHNSGGPTYPVMKSGFVSTAITLKATSSGGNTNAATAGSADVYLLVSVPP